MRDDELTRGGSQSTSDLVIVLHMPDLEDAGLVDADGKPAIRKGDRVEAIEDLDGNTVFSYPDPPGLYVEEAVTRGFGLNYAGTPKPNLGYMRCTAPPQAETG